MADADNLDEEPAEEPIHDSAMATRADRLARREARPLRRVQRFFQEFFPLLLLAVVATGAFVTFYRQEKVRTPGGDALLAGGFVVVVLVVGYLNPEVQRWMRVRGRGHLKE